MPAFNSPALDLVNAYIRGAEHDGKAFELGRYHATRAFLTMIGDERGGQELLAVAAAKILGANSAFVASNILDARLVLLGAPHQANTVLARIVPGTRPSAELRATTNLAALLAGHPDLISAPSGGKNDAASAIVARHASTVGRIARADITRLNRLGNRHYDRPDHWFPVWAALLARTAQAHGLALKLPVIRAKTG